MTCNTGTSRSSESNSVLTSSNTSVRNTNPTHVSGGTSRTRDVEGQSGEGMVPLIIPQTSTAPNMMKLQESVRMEMSKYLLTCESSLDSFERVIPVSGKTCSPETTDPLGSWNPEGHLRGILALSFYFKTYLNKIEIEINQLVHDQKQLILLSFHLSLIL